MVAIIDPKKHEVILDPACGTAGFLISSYKHIIKQNSSNYLPEQNSGITGEETQSVNEVIITTNGYSGDKLTADERRILADNIHGYDISPDMVRLSLVNMYLHGIKEPHISEYDTLTSEDHWNQYCDVILANPPFMSPKGGIRPHKRFSVPSNRSEVLFVDYIAEHLTPDGRAIVIVPEGIIFQSGTAYKSLRKMLVEKYLVGVISLPAGVFQPYSGVKTSILWLDKVLAKKTDKILFVKVENDGFDLGAQRRAIKGSDLPSTFQKISAYKDQIIFGSLTDFEQITDILLVEKNEISSSKDYNLSSERYKKHIAINSDFPIVSLSEVAQVIAGQSPSGEYYNEDGIGMPFYQGKTEFGAMYLGTPQKWTTQITKEADEGDILMSVRAPVGPVNFATNHICIGRGLAAIRSKDNIHKKYLFHLLKSKEGSIKGNGGAVFDSISKTLIEEIQIPLPPLSIQEEIVSEIESYEKIIDGARMVVENYKPRIEIDPEWEMVELGDHIDFISGLTLSIPDSERIGGTPIISMNSLTEDGEIIKEGWRNGSTRLVGKTGYFDWDGIYVFASFLLGIRTKQGSFIPRFLWFLLNQYRADGMYISFMRQNVNGLFNREELKILKVPLPSINEQQLIIDRIEKEMSLVRSVKELITVNEQKIKDRIAKVWGE
jgi:type I restriction enzyme M protein